MSQQRFTAKELGEFSRYLSNEYGIDFQPQKYSFLENRILPLMQKFECNTPCDLQRKSKQELSVKRDLLNSLTTNETWFFRHRKHFQILKDTVIPELIKDKKKKKDSIISIWSAGSSIGAELFSILITLLENVDDFSNWTFRLIGSDLSENAINRAKEGIYVDHEIADVSAKILKKYFIELGNKKFVIKPQYQKMVSFEVFNLVDRLPNRTFDVIFCRNTLIYFDQESKAKMTERFYKALNLGGFYFTSANETIHWGKDSSFKRIFFQGDYIYQKASNQKKYVIYYFDTPTDLLKALNTLTRSGLEHHLKKIPTLNNLSPKRAIYLPENLQQKTEEMFTLSRVSLLKKEVFIQ